MPRYLAVVVNKRDDDDASRAPDILLPAPGAPPTGKNAVSRLALRHDAGGTPREEDCVVAAGSGILPPPPQPRCPLR